MNIKSIIDKNGIKYKEKKLKFLSYLIFENEMYNLLEANSKYNGINDNIMDSIWTHAYDIMDEIINKDV